MSFDTPADPLRPAGPSDAAADIPAVSRLVGMVGLMAAAGGVVTVVASQYGPRWLPEGAGYLLAALGVACLFYHAIRDADPEVRRVYGAAAGVLLLAALVLAVVPGRAAGEDRQLGYYLLPWGAVAGLLALIFAVPFARHETDEPYLGFARAGLLGAGGVLCVGSVLAGAVWPNTLVGPGVVCAVLGLGYLAAYLGGTDAGDGPGYKVAVGLALLGGAAVVTALARSVAPTVLHDGPAALKNPLQQYDLWKVGARVAAVVACLGVTYWGAVGRVPAWLRGVLVVLGLAAAGVFVAGSSSSLLTAAPEPYLVPSGLLLGAVGLLYLLAGVAVVRDAPLVVLTRRELSSYFLSPIAYIVLVVMALASGLGYALFLGVLRSGEPLLEPILQDYLPGTFTGPLLVPFLVPALTMRLFSEEKRSQTLEVLLTAPVTEAQVVWSKFLGCWAFYMLCWVPAGVYLVGLRVEGGSAFDYRPLLSFYLTLGVSGAAFIAVGLFFSSLTNNQVVAAVMTFVVMLFLMVVRWSEFFPFVGSGVKTALGRLSYWTLWVQALRGQLPVRDVLVQASVAVFGVYLTVKVLEARKWT